MGVEEKQSRPPGKSHARTRANGRGIWAIRRTIHPDSMPILRDALPRIRPSILNRARLFDASTLGVSVVPYSCYTDSYKRKGPPTAEIVEGITSLEQPIEAEIGAYMLAGGGETYKLALELYSPGLFEENAEISEAFTAHEFALDADINAPDGEFVPHCSTALVYRDHWRHFKDDYERAKLDKALALAGTVISLAAPKIR